RGVIKQPPSARSAERALNEDLWRRGLRFVLIPIRDALQEAVFLVGQRGLAELLDLVEQFIHAEIIGRALFLFLLQLPGGALGEPALDEILLLPPGRRRFVLLQTRVALRKIVAKQRILVGGFEHHHLLSARD